MNRDAFSCFEKCFYVRSIVHDFKHVMDYNRNGDLNVICYLWYRKTADGSAFAEIKKTVSL